MSPTTLIIILIVLNIPVYVFFAWVMFDDLRESSSSILGGFMKVFSVIITGHFFARLLSDDDNSMVSVIIVLIVSVGVVWGEFSLITSWWPSLVGR